MTRSVCCSLALGAAGAMLASMPTAVAADGLRVAAWNITFYNGGQTSDIRTVLYGSFGGRSMEPDVVLLQEFQTQSALNSFVAAANSAPGSPGDWVAAPFFANSGSIHTAMAYRESKLDLDDSRLIAVGGTSPNHPRNIVRYTVQLEGYAAPESFIAMYPTHMKAGTSSSDRARRLLEAQRVRDNAQALPSGWSFILAGDFNTRSSSEPSHVELLGSQANNLGRFFDPISTPGNWNNNSLLRYVHTQDPVGGGGMDDRYDMLLVSGSLVDGQGLDYRGNFGIPFSTSTWDDPNHSYCAWGNDGTSYNTAMTTTGNQMVGPAIAQAIRNTGGNAGHAPVFMDLTVPAQITADAAIDFGTVNVGDPASAVISVGNAGDVSLWGPTGIQTLSYSFSASPGLGVPVGTFSDAPGGGLNSHAVIADTTAAGPISGLVTIASNAADEPTLIISVTGEVIEAGCGAADLAAPLGTLDIDDVLAFLDGFASGDPIADLAAPTGVLDIDDVLAFLDSFAAGCP